MKEDDLKNQTNQAKPKDMLAIVSAIIIIIIIIISLTLCYLLDSKNIDNTNNEIDSIEEDLSSNKSLLDNQENTADNHKEILEHLISNQVVYEINDANKWEGEFHQDNIENEDCSENRMDVVSYLDYLDIINKINMHTNERINVNYTNKDRNYIILCSFNDERSMNFNLYDVFVEDNTIIVYGNEKASINNEKNYGYFVAIPTQMDVGSQIEFYNCYSEEEVNAIMKESKENKQEKNNSDIWLGENEKPIIYLYPKEETKVSVKLGNKENITCSYPKYIDGWKVVAKPNGDLIDIGSDKKLYALYYESKADDNYKVEKEGFVVKGEDTAAFLEETLPKLGLNYKETEEFIVYWLPRLEKSNYNYIRFASMDEINNAMPLEINPKPDSMIRVLMIFKGLDAPIKVANQKIDISKRNGFAVVEWGGSEIR